MFSVICASLIKSSSFRIKYHNQIVKLSGIMPPKRKTTAAKKKVEEPKTTKEEPEPIIVGEPETAPKKRGGRSAKPVEAVVEPVEVEEEEEVEEEPAVKKRTRQTKGITKDKPTTSTSTEFLNPTKSDFDNVEWACNKQSPSGKKANFRVTSWNVDGLRAWVKKDGLKILDYEKPDIFCLQEIKCSKDKLPDEVKDVDGYKIFWESGKDDGLAGVALFSRKEPISVDYGIGLKDIDEEGRTITAQYEQFYLICVYVPNAGRKLVTLSKRLEWNKAFKTYVKKLDKKKPVIICGDMNVAHNEIDLSNPKTNLKNAGFTKEEREGMTEFLADGYVDSFRKIYPDKVACYTYWSYMMKCRAKNVGWRLDYFIVSQRLMDNVCDNVVRNEILGSDHCPITLFLNI